MFDLEKAILEWRGKMAARGINSCEVLDELESHLRDETARLIRSGCDEESAFKSAVVSVGEAAVLRAEFAKASGPRGRSTKTLKGLYGGVGTFMLLINTWTLLAYELSPAQRLFGIIAVAIISLYLALLPHWLEGLPSCRISWLAALIKLAANLVWLGPIVALLETQKVIHLGLGILPTTLLWCLYAAVVMTILAHGLVDVAKNNSDGSPPPLQPPSVPAPTRPVSAADLFRLVPLSKPVDPFVQQCLQSARDEASRLGHCYIGTEHLLLGLLKGATGSFAKVLRKLDLNGEAVRMEIERLVSPVTTSSFSPQIPFTPRARRAIRLAGHEAKAMNHSFIGVEDLLIGLLREGSGVGAKALKNLGVHIEKARTEIVRKSNHRSIL